MSVVELEKIKANFADYLQRVVAGETLIIASQNRPLAELRPTEIKLSSLRPFGLCAGEFIVPGDFDAPLPDNILAVFEAK